MLVRFSKTIHLLLYSLGEKKKTMMRITSGNSLRYRTFFLEKNTHEKKMMNRRLNSFALRLHRSIYFTNRIHVLLFSVYIDINGKKYKMSNTLYQSLPLLMLKKGFSLQYQYHPKHMRVYRFANSRGYYSRR